MIPNVTYSEVRGDAAAAQPPVENIVAVIGNSSLGTVAGTGSGAVKRFGNAQTLSAQRGVGPGQRLLGHILRLRENITRVSGVFCRVADSVAGSFGTINTDDLTGDVVPAVSGSPLDEFELYFEVAIGGTIGQDGITFYADAQNGRTDTPALLSLGTASSYTWPSTGATLTFNPPSAAIIALVNDLRTDFIAHFALTSGSVHLAADTTSDDGIGSAATNLATAITLVNQLRAALVLHGANLTAHTIADTNIETGDLAPAATDGQTAVTLANDLKSKYNAHRVLLTGTVHGAADSTNVTSAADATHGDLEDGDIIRVRTTGPKWDTDALAAGFTALAESSEDFDVLVISGPVSASEAAAVSAGITTLEERGKRPAVLFAARGPDEGEAEEDWLDDVKADFVSYTDDRVTKCAIPARCTIDDGARVLILDTVALAPVAAHCMAMPDISTSPADVGRGALTGVSLVNEDGDRIHHDEADNPTLDDPAHFLTLRRLPDSSLRTGTYITNPWLCYPAGGKIFIWPDRRVANLLARTAVRTSLTKLGSKLVVAPSVVQGAGILSEPAAEAIRGNIAGRCKAAVKNNITNPDDPGLVIVDRNVTTVGPQTIVPVTLKPIFYQYAGAFEIKLDVVR
jgi:hypothetical protein